MNRNNAPAGTIRAALRYPAFRRLLTGLAISQVGDWLYNLALVALVYQRTHSALWAGVTTAARVVPAVALGPLGGVVADRFDRRLVMIASDLIRVGLMLVLALVAAAHLPVLLAPVIAAAATAASRSMSATRARSQMIMMRRRSNRSASTPPTGPRTTTGTTRAAVVTPAHTAEWVRS